MKRPRPPAHVLLAERAGLDVLFAFEEAATYLRISLPHLRVLVRDEVLHAVDQGSPGVTRRHRVIAASELARFVSARSGASSDSECVVVQSAVRAVPR